MSTPQYVKNRLTGSFGILFSIMYGLILSDHVKKAIEQAFSEKADHSLTLLSFTVFLFFTYEAFESFIDFNYNDKKIEAKQVPLNLGLYVIWFLHFIPLYVVVYHLHDTTLSQVTIAQGINLALMAVFGLYTLYNLIEATFNRTDADLRRSSFKDALFHITLILVQFNFYLYVNVLPTHLIYLLLSLLILITTLGYALYWREYFKDLLFEKVPSEKEAIEDQQSTIP